MKKVSSVMLCLAGLSLLAAVIMKMAGMTHGLFGTVPSSYLWMTQIFLLAAIALRGCCCDSKCEKKD
jgi:hypothetical protein